MYIEKVIIKNFKVFDEFEMSFSENINVIVGNNNEGKSTIFEAIHLALTATIGGKNVLADIPAFIFNKSVVEKYIADIQHGAAISPPVAYIELFFSDKVNNNYYVGNNNSLIEKSAGVKIIFELNPDCVNDYKEYIAHKEEVRALPVEYYHCVWYTFADNGVVRTSLPVRSNYIDITSGRYLGSPDKQVLQIIEDALAPKDRTDLTIAYRKLREKFQAEPSIDELNKKVAEKYKDISDKTLSLDISVASKTNWETSLTTYFDDVPFSQIGKGEQSSFKIKLALSSQKDKCNVVLIEEPENHLSHSNMSKLLDDISKLGDQIQVIISTHSAYVLNKLNLKRVVLLQNRKTMGFSDLKPETAEYFEKLPGFDTLRLILAKRVFLVEGPSDELVIQKIYMQKHKKLPIEDGIDIISVRGTSFARFLEIAQKLNTDVVVIADNDKKATTKRDKFSVFTGAKIRLAMSMDDSLYTLEKILIAYNGRSLLNEILKKEFESDDDLLEYMIDNKTECALAIFKSDKEIEYIPEVKDAI